MSTTTRPAPLLRTIGDLDSPLWGDERSRTLWLEASAIAQQLMVMGAWLLAIAMVWVGGRPLFWWSVALIWVAGLGNIAALRYATAYGLAQPSWSQRLRMPRQWLLLALAAAWAAGAALAYQANGVSPSFAWGFVAGAVVAIVGVTLAERRLARAAALPEDDSFED